jgi:hypothetical protein
MRYSDGRGTRIASRTERKTSRRRRGRRLRCALSSDKSIKDELVMAGRKIGIVSMSDAQILRARDAALPQRRAAHRAHPQLLHRRRPRALHVDARLQRAAPHGLGRLRSPRRKRRHEKSPPAPRMDPRQHRKNEAHPPRASLFPTIGTAKSPPASPNIIAGTSGSSSACSSAAWPIAKRPCVNWCPECATVLANEQVVDGCCWRHEDTPVEQRALRAMVPPHHRLRR